MPVDKDNETGVKIQELQILEQSLQPIVMQRQAFLLELDETEKAIEEIKNSGEDVYKIVSQLLIKSNKEKILKDLEKKRDLLNLRIKNLEKQEDSMAKKLESLRDDISKRLK